MDLTSVRRVKFALGITKADEDRILAPLVGAASSQIARWLRRMDQSGGDALELKQRTEYLDPIPGERVIYPSAYPITSISSLYGDYTGRFTGDESQVSSDNYITSGDGRSIVMVSQPAVPTWVTQLPTCPRGVRLIYTGGLAADPVLSTWTKSADDGGSLTVDYYIRGESSLAFGRTTAASAGGITYEALSGTFLENETVKEYKRLDGSLVDGDMLDPTGVSFTLTACSARSLAESHPALVQACEMQVSYLRKNRDNFENLTVVQDGATRFSRADLKNRYDFLPEIVSLLAPYRNNLVRA